MLTRGYCDVNVVFVAMEMVKYIQGHTAASLLYYYVDTVNPSRQAQNGICGYGVRYNTDEKELFFVKKS